MHIDLKVGIDGVQSELLRGMRIWEPSEELP